MSKKQNWYTNPRKFHFIYKTTCQVNGKYYYGMHSTDNLDDGYIGSGTKLWHSIRKHGRENFKLEILEFCLDRESLKKREAELITEEMLHDPQCMNLSFGGGEIRLTKEQYKARNLKCQGKRLEKIKSDPDLRQHYSDTMADTNRRFTPERNRRLNPIRNQRVHLGAKRSQETKDLMSVSGSGEKNSMFGKVWILNEDLKISKRVSKAEVDSHLTSGWKLGRRMKF